MFEDLGLKYLGPVDGHDRPAVERALMAAKKFGGPVLVHVLTTKGQGYDIAVANENDQMHQANPFDRQTGEPIQPLWHLPIFNCRCPTDNLRLLLQS